MRGVGAFHEVGSYDRRSVASASQFRWLVCVKNRGTTPMYRAPINDIKHALFDIAGMRGFLEQGLAPDLSEELVDAILTEAGRFAGEEIAPAARIGDEVGAKLKDGVVTTP